MHYIYTYMQSRIGIGSRGQVFRAATPDGKKLAVKVLMRSDEDTQLEIGALTKLNTSPHPNIIGLQVSYYYN